MPLTKSTAQLSHLHLADSHHDGGGNGGNGGGAAHRLSPVAPPGELQHEAGTVPRARRRDRREHAGHRLAERRDHGVDPAVDVGQQGSLVRHAARR